MKQPCQSVLISQKDSKNLLACVKRGSPVLPGGSRSSCSSTSRASAQHRLLNLSRASKGARPFSTPPPPSGADSFLVSDCAQEDPEVAKAFGMRLLRIEAWGHSNAFRVCDQ